MDGEVREYSEIDDFNRGVLEDALEKDIRDLVAFLVTQSENAGKPLAVHAYTDSVHFQETIRSQLQSYVPPRYAKALDHFAERLDELATPIFNRDHPTEVIRLVLNIGAKPIVDRPTPGSPTAYAHGDIENSTLRHGVMSAGDARGLDPEMYDVPSGFAFLAEHAFEDPADRSTQENKPGNVYSWNEYDLNKMEEERQASAARLMKYSGIEPETKGHGGEEPGEEMAEGAEAGTWLERQNRENEEFFKRREGEERVRQARERDAKAFEEDRRRNDEFFDRQREDNRRVFETQERNARVREEGNRQNEELFRRQGEGENRHREQEEIARLREESEAAAGGAATIARMEALFGYIHDHATEISQGRGLSALEGLGGLVGGLRRFVSHGLGGEDLLGRAASDIDKANELMAELRHLREESAAEAAARSAEGAPEARGGEVAGGAETRGEEGLAVAEVAGEPGRIAGEGLEGAPEARGGEVVETARLAGETAQGEARIGVESGEVVMRQGEPVETGAAETAVEVTGEGGQAAADEALAERARATAEAAQARVEVSADAAQRRADESDDAAAERRRAIDDAEERARARRETIEEDETAATEAGQPPAEGEGGELEASVAAAEAGGAGTEEDEQRQPSEQESPSLGEQLKEHIVEEAQKETFAPIETADTETRDEENRAAADAQAERDRAAAEAAQRRADESDDAAEERRKAIDDDAEERARARRETIEEDETAAEVGQPPAEGEELEASVVAAEAGTGAGVEGEAPQQPSEQESPSLGEQLKEHIVEEAQKKTFAPIETADETTGAETRDEENRAAADAQAERDRAAAEAAQRRADESDDAAAERRKAIDEGAEERARARRDAIEEEETAAEVGQPPAEGEGGELEASVAAAEAGGAGTEEDEQRQPSEQESPSLGEQLKEHIVEEAQKEAFAPIETADAEVQQEPKRPGAEEETGQKPEGEEPGVAETAERKPAIDAETAGQTAPAQPETAARGTQPANDAQEAEAAQPETAEPEVVGAESTDAGTPPTEVDQRNTEPEGAPQPSEKEDSHGLRERVKDHIMEKALETAGVVPAAPEEEQMPIAASETLEQQDEKAKIAAASEKEQRSAAAHGTPEQPVQPSEKPSAGLGREIRHAVGHFLEEMGALARGETTPPREQPAADRKPPPERQAERKKPPAPRRVDTEQARVKAVQPRQRKAARTAAAPPRQRSAQNAQTTRAAPKTSRTIRVHPVTAEPFALLKKGEVIKARPAPKAETPKASAKNRPVHASRSNPPPKTKTAPHAPPPRRAPAPSERKHPAAPQERRAPRSGSAGSGSKPSSRKPRALNSMGQKRGRYDSLPKPMRPGIPEPEPQ